MSYRLIRPSEAADGLLAGVLVSSPAWVPALSDINEALTTITLILGVALGVARLWRFVRRRLDRDDLGPPVPPAA